MHLRSALRSTLSCLLLLAACGGPAAMPDAGTDAGPADSGAVDSGADAGPVDLGLDLGPDPTYPGLTADVTVIRDHTGIPHIYGTTDEDVFFAHGYEQAKDRLFTMDLMRRRAEGRSAEVLGAGSVSGDSIVRMVDLPRWAHEDAIAARLHSPSEYALLVAWAAGVNHFIDEVTAGTQPLPFGFGAGAGELGYMPERWVPEDAFLVSRGFLFNNANQLEYDILATILRDYQSAAFANIDLMTPIDPAFVLPLSERPATHALPLAPPPPAPLVPPADLGARIDRFFTAMQPFHSGGSNNWAVDGSHTVNGRPMICSDPHQPLQSPSLFWAAHMNSKDAGGRIDAVGFTIVGSPGIALGHTDRVSWAATTTYPDIMDIWEVPFSAGVVHLGTGDVPGVVRTTTIHVKGAADVTKTFVDVPGYGILLPADFTPLPLASPGHRVLFDWTGFRPVEDAHVFFDFDRATSVADMDTAVGGSSIAAFNFVYADATSLGYRVHVLLPDRGNPATHALAYMMMDGSDPATLWTGAWAPDTQLPASHATGRGWIASANNDPFGFTADGRADDDPWYYGVYFDPGTRATRIEDELARLSTRGNITVADMEALQTDTRSLVADQILPVLDDAYAHVPTDPALAAYRGRADLDALVAMLHAWDHRMDMDASEPVAYEGFQMFLTKAILADDLNLTFDAILGQEPIYLIKWAVRAATRAYPNADMVMQEGRDVLVLRALSDTAAWLTARFGGTDPSMYRWSDFHGTHFSGWIDALDGGWHATSGGEGTVNVSSTQFFDSHDVPRTQLESHAGPIYRYVTQFAADGVPETVVTIPHGESGDPTSPHFADTTEDWIHGVYRPLLFRHAEVVADMESTETLATGTH